MSAAIIAIIGLIVGCAAGFVTRRARLCTFGAFEDAVATFATRYADRNERDHAALVAAVRAGRVEARSDA